MKYISALILFTWAVSSFKVSAGTDYEAQFNHSIKRWVELIEYYRPVTKPIGLVYLCETENQRDQLAKEFKDNRQLKSEESNLAYNSSLVVFHFEKPSVEEQIYWLRRNFFIGIAYGCSLDGFH
ncbi:hypothetical protein RI845_07410 [Thalassotalea nanhaiensis]|uniref:Uncharacterized protein n=1 Tax=Thalassotalea nanhaiensis TaxID=3065648 RepID=A0ABY9TMM0_9GAMM|nr:hypothetical protein RI845_07410 [Colwelliaceae bacterium SQ345]